MWQITIKFVGFPDQSFLVTAPDPFSAVTKIQSDVTNQIAISAVIINVIQCKVVN